MVRAFAALGLAALVGGCIPTQLEQIPELQGQVVDATTGNPIAAAMVVVSSSVKRVEPVAATTDESGKFLVASRNRTWWRPIDCVTCEHEEEFAKLTVQVSASGYRASELTFDRGAEDSIKRVALQPTQAAKP